MQGALPAHAGLQSGGCRANQSAAGPHALPAHEWLRAAGGGSREPTGSPLLSRANRYRCLPIPPWRCRRQTSRGGGAGAAASTRSTWIPAPRSPHFPLMAPRRTARTASCCPDRSCPPGFSPSSAGTRASLATATCVSATLCRAALRPPARTLRRRRCLICAGHVGLGSNPGPKRRIICCSYRHVLCHVPAQPSYYSAARATFLRADARLPRPGARPWFGRDVTAGANTNRSAPGMPASADPNQQIDTRRF